MVKRWDKLVQANQILLADEPIVPLFQQAVVIMRKTEFKKIGQFFLEQILTLKTQKKVTKKTCL